MLHTLLFRAKYYILHLFTSKGAHALHSPFVFKLYNEVIKRSSKNVLPEIEKVRKELQINFQLIDVADIKRGTNERKTVSSIAKSSLSQPKFSSFMSLLLSYLNTKIVLEAGTSLGINALYMSKAAQIKTVATIEGSPIIASIAEDVFQKHNSEIELIKGSVYEVFESSMIKYQPQVIFIDADHRGEAIEFYLETILKHLPDIKCIVVHDIYWSKDMFVKWNEIVKNERYTLTIDIFQAGLIFPSIAMPKQHFKLKF